MCKETTAVPSAASARTKDRRLHSTFLGLSGFRSFTCWGMPFPFSCYPSIERFCGLQGYKKSHCLGAKWIVRWPADVAQHPPPRTRNTINRRSSGFKMPYRHAKGYCQVDAPNHNRLYLSERQIPQRLVVAPLNLTIPPSTGCTASLFPSCRNVESCGRYTTPPTRPSRPFDLVAATA